MPRSADAARAAISARLLDPSRRARRMAVAALAPDRPAAIFALRSVMVRDEDAEIRAAAADRLRSAAPSALVLCDAAVGDALAGALEDESQLVREAAARTAGALRAERAHQALRRALRDDAAWNVRRAAARALAAALAEGAAPDLIEALDDPFWRVRFAAIQALAERPPTIAPDPSTSPRRAAAFAYLAALSARDAAPTTPGEPEIVLPDAAKDRLGDDDPAVVAARLAASAPAAADPSALIAALANPHESLRRVAVHQLAARARARELTAALTWLDEPRIAYANEALQRLLRRVHAQPLAAHVLADPAAGTGALAWALDAAARIDIAPRALHLAAERASHSQTAPLRRAAMRCFGHLGDSDSLLRGLHDPDETVRAEVVAILGSALDDAALRQALPSPGAGIFIARALLGAIRDSLGRALDEAARAWLSATLSAAALTSWADVRAEAIALRARLSMLTADERAAALADPDPWLREAAVDAIAGCELLDSDPDPFVRRSAARAALAHDAELPLALRAEAALRAARSADPWLRATAAAALDAASESGFACLLQLTRDSAPMVRAAASDALDRTGDLEARCLRLARSDAASEAVRLAAHARLIASTAASGLAALAADLAGGALSPSGRQALFAMMQLYPEELRKNISVEELPSRLAAAAVNVALPAADRAALVGMRELGGTGIAVAPLGISGAGGLTPPCFAAARDAGVNLFFWEPQHRALTEFAARAARRHDLVMVAGSYEADRASIERDVERALRRLRIDAVGVMLLFWVRSRARLEEGAMEALVRLKERGKVRAIGFSTHHRELAEEALRASPWDVVMCRLSAAHPGAERSLLPAAVERRAGVIAFSALSYGRLLAGSRGGAAAARLRGRGASAAPPPLLQSDEPAVTAADCYRYCLSQPGVSVCLSAPRRYRELAENLTVLARPELEAAEIERLRSHGRRVHESNRAFSAFVHKV